MGGTGDGVTVRCVCELCVCLCVRVTVACGVGGETVRRWLVVWRLCVNWGVVDVVVVVVCVEMSRRLSQCVWQRASDL